MIGEKRHPDARVEKLLIELGLKYTIDDDGDFRLGFQLEHDRSQLVWINSNTSTYRGMEVREVWAPAYRSPVEFPADVSFRLLRQNRKMKLGAWEAAKMGDDYFAVFSVKISAEPDAETLLSVIKFVVEAADEMEQELTGKDEF